MMLPDTPTPTPSRQRVFELMRQSDAAIERADEIKPKKVRRLSPAELEKLQMIALRSFQRDDLMVPGQP
ncbi:hypothetical protein [uncultured Tateyamaria sp.]|uniref:hypothetical protein n=1 Tax=uncultured Tateyamaria sp. TaxID=455651 RepID=UPI00260AC4EF|nr:hypothetical protein [uncultured Tateyamaria sp.]